MTRKVVPAAGATPSGPAVNAYEEQRNARIARNNQMLSQLGVKEAAAKVAQPAITTWRRSKPPCSKQACGEAAEATPVRLSKRLRGQATPVEEGVGGAVSVPAELDEDYGRLLSVDEFLERKGLQKGPLMTGHFMGWVEEGVRQQLGLAGNAAEAWESGGGGVFERRCPKGESAKEFARAALRKNPNAYFYRHNTPGEDTWQGEWSEEEIANFVQVATTYGCGDKWGLFASYIPHRVGYQCSAAYRHILIPRGLLRDNNFKMTASGETIWQAGRGGRGRKAEEE